MGLDPISAKFITIKKIKNYLLPDHNQFLINCLLGLCGRVIKTNRINAQSLKIKFKIAQTLSRL